MMKRILFPAILSVFCAAVFSAEAKPENDFKLKVSYLDYAPEDDDTYDDSTGIELQFQSWVLPNTALAISIGQSTWDMTSDGGPSFTDIDQTFSGRQDGDISLVPIGVSAIYRTDPLLSIIRLQVEAGIRYVYISSDFDLVGSKPTQPPSEVRRSIDVDDALIALIAADVQVMVMDRVSLFLGAGLQQDIIRPEFNGPIGDGDFAIKTSLNSFFARIGAAISF